MLGVGIVEELAGEELRPVDSDNADGDESDEYRPSGEAVGGDDEEEGEYDGLAVTMATLADRQTDAASRSQYVDLMHEDPPLVDPLPSLPRLPGAIAATVPSPQLPVVDMSIYNSNRPSPIPSCNRSDSVHSKFPPTVIDLCDDDGDDSPAVLVPVPEESAREVRKRRRLSKRAAPKSPGDCMTIDDVVFIDHIDTPTCTRGGGMLQSCVPSSVPAVSLSVPGSGGGAGFAVADNDLDVGSTGASIGEMLSSCFMPSTFEVSAPSEEALVTHAKQGDENMASS